MFPQSRMILCLTPIKFRAANKLAARSDQDLCFPKTIGYKPAEIMSAIDGTSFSHAGTNVTDSLTNAFILHPIACGLAFIAAFCAIGGVAGSLIATVIAVIAWTLTLVVTVIDFVVFGVFAL